MPTVSELVVTVSADTRDLDAGIAKAEQSVGGLGSSLKSGIGAGIGMGALDLAIGAITTGMGALKTAVIDVNGSLEQSQIAFTTMLGSGEKAESFLKELQNFAAATPFEFPDLVSASKRMLAFGFESKQVVPLLTAVGDAVAAVGGGAETIDGVTTAIGQMQAKGKVSAEEMGQLAERGIPAWDMLAKKMGVTVPEAMEAVSKGAVKAGTFIEAFQEGAADRFGGMMEKQSATFSGAMSTIADSVTMATATAFKPFFQLLSQGAVALSKFVQSEDFTRWAGAVAAAIGTAVAALTSLISYLGFASSEGDHMNDFLSEMPTAIQPFVAAIGFAVAAITALATVLSGPFDESANTAYQHLVAMFGPDMAQAIVSFSAGAVEAIGALGEFILEEFGVVFDWWAENWPMIEQVVETVLLGMALLWNEHGEEIMRIVRDVWTIISTVIDLALKNLLSLITIALKLLTGDWQGAWDEAVRALERTVLAWQTILSAAFDLIYTLVDTATGGLLTKIGTWLTETKTAITTGWNAIVTATTDAWTGTTSMLSVITAGWTQITDLTRRTLSGDPNALLELVQIGWGLIKTAIDTVFGAGTGDTITGVVTTGWNAVVSTTRTVLTDTTSGLAKVVTDAWAGVVDAIRSLGQAGSELLSAVTGVGNAIVSTILEGINSKWQWFKGELERQVKANIPETIRNILGLDNDTGVLAKVGERMVEELMIGIKNKWPSLEDLWERLGSTLGGSGGKVSGDVTDWLKAAIAITGVSDSWLSGLERLVQWESGGNPTARNPESVKGQHATGLLQTLPSTFRAYALPGMDNILNPIHNAVAAIRYIDDTYGSVYRIPGIRDGDHSKFPGYALGGWAGLHGPELAWLGERGPEYVVPTSALGGAAAHQTMTINIAVGGQVSRQIVVEGYDLAVRSGWTPAGLTG